MNQTFIPALFDERVPFLKEIHDYKAYLNDEDFLLVGATVFSLLKKTEQTSTYT